MNAGDWLLGAGTLLVGQALGLGGEIIRRRWSDTSERRRRMEERGEQAAGNLMGLLDEGRRLVEVDGPLALEWDDQQQVYELCHRIEREALLLPDPMVRRWMEHVVEALWFSNALYKEMSIHSQGSLVFAVSNAGKHALGAMLRGESLSELPELLAETRRLIMGSDDSVAERTEKAHTTP
jgi:hypothetical protein